MSHSPTADVLSRDDSGIRRALAPAGLAVLVVAGALTVYGAHDLREILVVCAVQAAVTAGVYGWLLPRTLAQHSAGGTALTLSVIAAILLLPAFWSGLPLVLGVAGALLGYTRRHSTTGAGKSTAALVIGTLTAIGYVAVYVLEAMSQMGVSGA